MELALAITVIVVALAFDYTNGFHDAANAIATSVSTRALTPRTALIMAAVLNLVGAMLGVGVAETIGSGIINLDALSAHQGLVVVLSGLIGAIIWNLITWWKGLPSSSTHAIIGGLMGAGIASYSEVQWTIILDKVVIPMIASPLVGFALAFGVMVGVLWLFRRSKPGKTQRRFRAAQVFSAASLALGHGLQDAQKTMGVIVLALVAGGFHVSGAGIPFWVKLAAATAISAGTYAGGFRIMRTLGRKIIEVDPARGFVAESVASSVLYTTAFVFQAPISTTHTITSAIMGVGATKRLSAVRWGVARSIGVAWVLTLPASALVAAIMYRIIHLFL